MASHLPMIDKRKVPLQSCREYELTYAPAIARYVHISGQFAMNETQRAHPAQSLDSRERAFS